MILENLKTGEGTSLGIDIGSTTAKIVVIENGNVIYERYERHFSQVRQKALEMIQEIRPLLEGKTFSAAISGSAGLGVAKAADVLFVQEVFAEGEIVKQAEPDTNVVVELGGEDAKVIFFKGGLDERMNGSCAGGTGAFIDQMATLLNVTTQELDELSLKSRQLYPIASRCGVFAKTDIQPLLNQGAAKADIAASIYQAVVNQTIAGLAQGRRIDGKVMFLGGPLYYCKGLRRRFVETLQLTEENAVFPAYALYAVAIGAAVYAAREQKMTDYETLVARLEASANQPRETTVSEPLFASKEEYEAFAARHAKATVRQVSADGYTGKAWLGIDCGSTTTKVVLINENNEIIYQYYCSSQGSPVEIVRDQLKEIYRLCGVSITLAGSAVTGYGEDLIRHAFHVDDGLVETMAHFTAARHFNPKVDFILDIGGQDIKCFRVHNDSIDSIMLNEACSSGCGSFIETFAKSMGYDVETFSKLGLFAKAPVDLGSRCTVFMNSSVKQAQKDGASIEDISAGLSMSIVKNAIYKVIRAPSADDLGQQIVVQGGTFLNDAVLRSFERVLGRDVIRPEIAGLMGAFGAALYARAQSERRGTPSQIITREALEHFTHKSTAAKCNGCENHCSLTINIFPGGERYISGNRCEKALGAQGRVEELPNLHEFKRARIEALQPGEAVRGTIGLPLALGMYEQIPLWHTFFTRLGYRVEISGFSNRELYSKGQYSIPSDTACYPAKIMHGHMETLIEKGVDAIFYPCLTYNVDEKISDNHYNCPVVAYYSELLRGNMESLQHVNFLSPYLNLNNTGELAKEMHRYLKKYLCDIPLSQVRAAAEAGMQAYHAWMEDICREGQRAIDWARENGKRILILAGRPYHIDPEISHGIDKLCTSLGFVTITEDSIAMQPDPVRVHVLNQWTYHARLYNAAQYAAEHDDTELVQLVSFGCGIDAITTDEVREILESHNKLYTQIKIDEITNLGAVRIRLRSLLGALEERGMQHGRTSDKRG